MPKKRMSLRAKAMLLVSLFMLITNLALGGALMRQSRTATKTQINERMLDIVNTAAAMLDGDVLASLTAEDKGTPEYQAVYDTLARFRDNINLDYIYYVRDMGNGVFTFGIDTDPVAPGEFGAPVVYTDALYSASQGVAAVDEEPYRDEWGRFYSAFSPVFDSAGKVAGVRRMEDREDHMVHAVGLGLTVIDQEMRDTMAKNEALAEALTMAEEANKAKTAFLSNMSHEIRTPMNAIIGLDTLALHDESLSPQSRDYLEKIGDSARHLLGLINDILDMSRIESGRITLRKEEFSFSAMLEQINTMVTSQCSDKGLHYECRILSHVDDYYIGDDMKLKEVLINILSNAIKFTESPGSVTLTVERTAEFEDQSTLKFVIKDTGIGMDKEFIPKIFDSFSQEDSSRKNKYGSTGLGMAITKNIVEMMNGTISVESEKGVGSQFTVAVTLRNCLHHGPETASSVDPGKLYVLVVDDEEIAAEHARTVLTEAGIRADACTSAAAALQMMELQHIKQAPYNLVLMDWKMPDTDGLEAARLIRERYSNESTVIILTAYNWDNIQAEALQSGVDSFLAKPLFASNVISEFERIARRSNMTLFKEKQRAELKGRKVLLAEDMPINAEIMMDILEMEDMEADHAENGRIAVELFEKSAPGEYSAILMDVRMPEMDGLEAAAAIRALDRPDAKKIPIIALTANAFDEDVQRSLQAGMNAHLSKPVESEHLFQTLSELISEAES